MSEPTVRVLDVPVSELGEGPLWSARERALYWIDIRAAVLHRWSETDGYTGAITLPSAPGCVVDGSNNTITVATESGLVSIDRLTQRITDLGQPPRAGGRYNDGAVDPAGRLWVGTIESRPGAADGVLYRVGPGLTSTAVRRGLVVPNGIDFSPDGRTMYLTVTELGSVYAYDLDPLTGALSREREIVHDVDCSPDGLVVDASGSLWSAKWSGSSIHQISPDGRLIRVVRLPVTNITSVAFGGVDLRTLYVTTAVDEPGGVTSEKPEWAGRVFAIDGLGATGSPLPVFDPSPRSTS